MNKLKIIFYLVCISASTLFAQVNNNTFNNNFNNTYIFEDIKSDAVTFYNVGFNLFQSPFQFDKNDLYLTSAILGITAASLPIDQPIRTGVLKNHNKNTGPRSVRDFTQSRFPKMRSSIRNRLIKSRYNDRAPKMAPLRITPASIPAGCVSAMVLSFWVS